MGGSKPDIKYYIKLEDGLLSLEEINVIISQFKL